MGSQLVGQRAIIVGGGSGIGFGSARHLAADGATVTIVGRTAARLERASAELAAGGLQVGWVTCDAMDSESVREAVAAASDDGGRLDIAVVVPGQGGIKPVLLFDSDEFSANVDGNLRPVFNLLKWSGRAMVRNGSGSFVAISSTAAAFSARFLAGYSAGKAAVDQLVRVAADELGSLGIRVNSVRPGLTRTPPAERSLENQALSSAFLDGQPIRRHGEIADIAAAVRYLAGPESSWVTGQHLAVDGGHTLRAFVDYSEIVDMADARAEILGNPRLAPEGPHI